jgi:hypothetical protein
LLFEGLELVELSANSMRALDITFDDNGDAVVRPKGVR